MTASSFNKRTSSRPTGNDEQGHTKSGGGVQFTQTESAHAGNEKLMRNPSSAQPQQSHSKAASAAYQDIQHSQHANSGANDRAYYGTDHGTNNGSNGGGSNDGTNKCWHKQYHVQRLHHYYFS